MQKNILLPIDILNPNTDLLRYAVFTAKTIGAKLLLLDQKLILKSVSLNKHYPPMSTNTSSVITTTAKQKLQHLCEQFYIAWEYTRTKLVPAELIAGRSKKKEYELLEETTVQNPSLILLEAEQKQKWKKEWLSDMSSHYDCSFLLIPEGLVYSEVMDINYLLDRQKPLSEVVTEIKFLKKMVTKLYPTANINILCKNDPTEKLAFSLQQRILRNELPNTSLSFTSLPKENTAQAIVDNIFTYSIDIFALSSTEHLTISPVEKVNLLQEQILKEKIPLLVF